VHEHTLSERSLLWFYKTKMRTATYLVPDANVTLIPLVPRVEVCALRDVVAKELEQVFTLLVSETFNMGDALGVDVQRFIAGGLYCCQTRPLKVTTSLKDVLIGTHRLLVNHRMD
jgi:hypothetical protein